MSAIKEVFGGMSAAFKPEAAKGVDAVFQYDISGDGGGKWHIIVKDGKCQVNEGAHATPSVTLSMDSATFMAMQSKQLNGMQAYMSGKLKIAGNIMLAQTFQHLFAA